MCIVEYDGIFLFSKLIYFRVTPAKMVTLSFNIPQLRAIAYKQVAAQGLIPPNISCAFEEKFKKFYFYNDLKDYIQDAKVAEAVDAKFLEVRSDIVSALQSQEFEIDAGTVRFCEMADYEDFAILRILLPHNQMQDFLSAVFWSLESDGVRVLAKTPIFNEGIAFDDDEFHSALAFISFTASSDPPSPPGSYPFPQTEFELLARASNCQICVEESKWEPCQHCTLCIAEGQVKERFRDSSCPHTKEEAH